MFTYLRTKKQFFKDCDAIDNCTSGMRTFIEHAIEYRKRANPNFGVSDDEVTSWEETFKLLKEYLSGTKADFKIALEFIHQFRNENIHEGDIGFARRTDVMIAVKEKTKKRNVWKKKIYIIEFKQWENPEEIKAPVEQVKNYCELFLANNDQVSMWPDPTGRKIQLIPVVWMFKMPKPAEYDEKLKELLNSKFGRHIKIRFKDENITDFWRSVPNRYDNDVFKQLRKGFPVFHLHDEVKGIWESQHLFNERDTWDKKDIINKNEIAGRKIKLRGDQNVCFRSLADRIGRDGEKGDFYIIGGAGSGKSLVAVLLFKFFKDKGMDVKFYIPQVAPVRAYDGPLGKILFERATDDNQTNYTDGDVVIVDEAHNLFENVYLKIKDNRQGKVTIFLSDGDQIDRNDQMGKICSDEEANNYYLNSQFRCNKDDGYITFVNDILNNEKRFPFKADCLDFDVQVIDRIDDDLQKRCKLLINDEKDIYENKEGSFNRFKPEKDVYETLRTNPGHFDPADLFVSNDEKSYYGTLYDIRGLDVAKTIVVIRKKDIVYKNNSVTVISPRKRHQTIQTKLNKYRILLTRATETCYIYCEDKALRDYLVNEKGIKVYKAKRTAS